MILRFQDKQGRGPFKRGVLELWCEYNHNLPATIHEFPNLLHDVKKYHDKGMHLGTGVRGIDGLEKWFSKSEMQSLYRLGYKIVKVADYVVVCESVNQVVFATKKPLKKLKTIHL